MNFTSFASAPRSPHPTPSSGRRRTLRRLARLAALGAACAAWTPGSAAAVETGAAIGPYVSFTFGEKLGIGYGIDTVVLFAADAKSSCTDGLGSGFGIGPSLQIGGINASTFQFVAALAAGGAVPDDEGLGIIGEAGITLHASKKERSGVGIHTGLAFQSSVFAHGFLRAEWLLDSYSLGAGVRAPHLFNTKTTCIDGRPLRGHDGALVASATASLGDALEDDAGFTVRGADREAAAAAWTRDALAEAASVPAFLQLVADLVAIGAPDALIDEAIAAAEDEVRHARACAHIASRLAGRRIAPALPASPLRQPLAGAEGMRRLAVESWLDGCLGEGAAAARAGLSARRAADPTIAGVRRGIAREEHGHAELGWSVLAWAVSRGGDEVRDAVYATRDATIATEDEYLADRDARAFGRVGRGDAESIHARHAARARRRIESLLA